MNQILGASVASTRAMCMFALVAGGLLLTGCGQKGPLFYPGGTGAAPVMTPNPIEPGTLQEEIVLPR